MILTHPDLPQIDEAEIDARADEALQYVADKAGRRLTFGAGGRLFALRFPDDARYDAFMKQLEVRTAWGADCLRFGFFWTAIVPDCGLKWDQSQ